MVDYFSRLFIALVLIYLNQTVSILIPAQLSCIRCKRMSYTLKFTATSFFFTLLQDLFAKQILSGSHTQVAHTRTPQAKQLIYDQCIMEKTH